MNERENERERMRGIGRPMIGIVDDRLEGRQGRLCRRR